jgi:four helix bundle protein
VEPSSSQRYDFRQLGLWRKAQGFAVEVARLVDTLPRRRSSDVAGSQLVRAATSIAANIAEGHGRFTLPAYRNHLSIAKGSACEARSWLDLLLRLGHVDAAAVQQLYALCGELIAALTRRIRSLEPQEKQRRVREAGSHYETEAEDREIGSKVPGFSGSKVPRFSGPVV